MSTTRVLILSVAIGAAIGAAPSIAQRPPSGPTLTPQLAAQVQAAARERAAYIAAGQPHGSLIHAGMGGVDSGVVVDGRFVQLEYLDCLADPAARWYEDGSAAC